MAFFDLNLDQATIARSLALVPAVQATYDAAGGYPPLVITQAYVYTNAIRVGLNWWTAPAYWKSPLFGTPPNQPTLTRLTPTIHVAAQTLVNILGADVSYATTIATALGVAQLDVLGCACCTGTAMLSGVTAPGSPDGSSQVGPFLFP